MTLELETEQERRERLAAALATVLDMNGSARFPRSGWPNWDGEELRERRRELWTALDDLEAAGRPVDIFNGDGATILRWRSAR
ncbi:MAG: hypothetical protein WKF41_09140 [Gaiellaceae bacterium]